MQDEKVKNSDGIFGRICNLKGTPQQNAVALQNISEMIIKFECNLNGVRKET